jgi:hypothetical protein
MVGLRVIGAPYDRTLSGVCTEPFLTVGLLLDTELPKIA